MPFTVRGTFLGSPYRLTFEDDRPIVTTSAVEALLSAMAGEPVTVPPVGPTYTLALDDGQSVLAALMQETTVEEIEGDYPAVVPPIHPGVVY